MATELWDVVTVEWNDRNQNDGYFGTYRPYREVVDTVSDREFGIMLIKDLIAGFINTCCRFEVTEFEHIDNLSQKVPSYEVISEDRDGKFGFRAYLVPKA